MRPLKNKQLVNLNGGKMQFNLSISDWISIIFGLCGLLGTSYTIWSKWDSKREKVEVKKSFGFLTYESRISDEYYLFLECINHGEKILSLSSCYLELPNKKNIPAYLNNVFGLNFPYELSSGKNFRYAFNTEYLTNTLIKQGYKEQVKLKPIFTTQKGNTFEGKIFDYPLAD